MGSARGLRGCQGYCFEGSDSAAGCVEFSVLETGESGMYSSSAASAASGTGIGSASSSKAEALSDGGAAFFCGGEKGAGTDGCTNIVGAAAPGAAAAALAACPLRNKASGNTQGAFGLLDVNRFGENQIGAEAKSLGYSRLSFDHCHGQRCLVRT